MFCYHNQLLPSMFLNLFVTSGQVHSYGTRTVNRAYCTLRNEMGRNEMERNEMERNKMERNEMEQNEMKNLYSAKRNGTKRNEKSVLCETKWDETK